MFPCRQTDRQTYGTDSITSTADPGGNDQCENRMKMHRWQALEAALSRDWV